MVLALRLTAYTYCNTLTSIALMFCLFQNQGFNTTLPSALSGSVSNERELTARLNWTELKIFPIAHGNASVYKVDSALPSADGTLLAHNSLVECFKRKLKGNKYR